MIAHRTIKTRILTLIGGIAVGYLCLMVMVQFSATATHRHMERVAGALHPAARGMETAEAAFLRMRKQYKDAILMEDADGLRTADADGDDVQVSLAVAVNNLDAFPQYKQRVQDLYDRFMILSATSRDAYGAMLRSKENMNDSLQDKITNLAKNCQEFSTDLDALDLQLADESRKEFTEVDATSLQTRMIGWFVLAAALLGCGGGWWVLQYQILAPLAQLSNRMKQIAEGDGDLTKRVEVHGRNEIDEVGRWFNVFVDRIEGIVVRVADTAATLEHSATALAQNSRETASQSAMQQEQAKRITRSMGEISAAVRDISKATKSAADDARTAEGNAHEGGKSIRSTVETIRDLQSTNQTMASKVEGLGASSQAIGRVVQVIDEIAEQTNLLALNASIESARAGEHGRGFAVVAMEVRRLAERTSKATREIAETVNAIQRGTSEVVDAMRAGVERVQTSVDSTHRAGSVLEEIIHGAESLQVVVSQIASSSKEQSYATHSVNDNINEIVSLGEQTIVSNQRAVVACDRLSSLATDLNQLVAVFKVGLTSPDDETVLWPPSLKHSSMSSSMLQERLAAL